jgi:transcription antitermination factor NusG
MKPVPISNDEVKAILMRSGDLKSDKSVYVSTVYKEGDEVRVVTKDLSNPLPVL